MIGFATSTITSLLLASSTLAAPRFSKELSELPLFNSIPIQDSYAGRIKANGTADSLFFWYFPSSKSGGANKLSVWLDGGPGCSSLEGATQETGAFNLLPGTTNPVINANGWTTESDMLYIEQPADVGFSTGTTSDLTGEVPLADDFYKFLVSFFEVFTELKAKDFYITGESYAGFYIPYIAERILHASATEKISTDIKLKGIFLIDGVYSDFTVGSQAPTARFASQNAAILGFNQTFLEYLNDTSQACGYETLLDSVQYPQPPGNIFLPNPSGFSQAPVNQTCDLFDLFYQEAYNNNPCFNIYHITDLCPVPIDPVGGGELLNGTFFNNPSIQAGLHVANSSTWYECSIDRPFINGTDVTAFSETVLPDILAHIPVLMVHGDIDAILFTQADHVTIQNMTWGGIQGYQQPITTPLLINGKRGGTWHSERNLTFVEIYDSGHMVPEYQPCLSLALFTALITSGSIGDGQLSAACSFTETFPVSWPDYSTLNGTVVNGTVTGNATTGSASGTGSSTLNGSSASQTVSAPQSTNTITYSSASVIGASVGLVVSVLVGSIALV